MYVALIVLVLPWLDWTSLHAIVQVVTFIMLGIIIHLGNRDVGDEYQFLF